MFSKSEVYSRILDMLQTEEIPHMLSESDALNKIISTITGEEWSAPPVESVNMLYTLIENGELNLGGLTAIFNEGLSVTNIEIEDNTKNKR